MVTGHIRLLLYFITDAVIQPSDKLVAWQHFSVLLLSVYFFVVRMSRSILLNFNVIFVFCLGGRVSCLSFPLVLRLTECACVGRGAFRCLCLFPFSCFVLFFSCFSCFLRSCLPKTKQYKPQSEKRKSAVHTRVLPLVLRSITSQSHENIKEICSFEFLFISS